LLNGKPHVAHNSGAVEWYTPAAIIAAVREVLNDIDLDPCSSLTANAVVQATRIFTEADNGLTADWIDPTRDTCGRIFMNPPYELRIIEPFVDRLLDYVAHDAVEAAIVLTNNATDTQWFQRLAVAADAFCFKAGRISFSTSQGASQSPLQGQVLTYVGRGVEAEIARFCAVFQRLGVVLRRLECAA
jgi:hypothetical protein